MSAQARTEVARVEETPVAAETEAAAIIQMIERVALNPNVNVDSIDRLLAMQERVMSREAERQFSEAMMAAQKEMPAVIRNATNDQTKSRYATLDAVSDAMDPVIHKHGFSLSFGTADSTLANHYRVTCKARHTGGHSEDYFADVPADMMGMKGNQNKTATHAFGSTMSYGRRYLKLLVFDVTLKNQDDDGRAAGAPVLGSKIADNQAAIDACQTIADLRAWKAANADAIQQMPSDAANAVVRAFNQRLQALKTGAAE